MKQADSVSPDAQQNRIRLWCEQNNCPLAGIYEDNGISGKRLANRPGALKAIEHTCSEKGILVVYSLSRLARSVRELFEISDRIEKAGAGLLSLTEPFNTTSCEGKLLFGILAVLAQFERELTSKRNRETAAYLKSQNRPYGKIPFGNINANGYLQPNPKEIEVINLVQTRYTTDGATKLAATLAFQGYTNRAGKPYTRAGLVQIHNKHAKTIQR